jgi:hypothetical protein
MRRLLLLPLLLAGCLLGANPVLYSGLGDPIYDGMPKLFELSEVAAVAEHKERIAAYLTRCRETKAEGFRLDAGAKKKGEIQAYLERLRDLDREYEHFVHIAQVAMQRSIERNDYKNFAALIGTGLIDIETQGDAVVGFYLEHNKQPPVEEIDAYIAYRNEIRALKAQERAKRRARYESYKKRRIEQIRQRQEAKKEAHREAIDAETKRIKEEVKRTQKTELERTR